MLPPSSKTYWKTPCAGVRDSREIAAVEALAVLQAAVGLGRLPADGSAPNGTTSSWRRWIESLLLEGAPAGSSTSR